MEKKYIQNKLKKELLNKEFKFWNYDTIDFLIYIYDFDEYYLYYNMNLLLLEDYIKWYEENSSEININMYSLEKLCQLRDKIKNDLNISNCYKNFLNNKNIKYESIFDNIYFMFIFILIIVFIIIKSIISLIYIPKKEQNEPKIFDNINSNSLIKLLLNNLI